MLVSVKKGKKGVNPEFNGIPWLALKMSFVVKSSEIASAFTNDKSMCFTLI